MFCAPTRTVMFGMPSICMYTHMYASLAPKWLDAFYLVLKSMPHRPVPGEYRIKLQIWGPFR